jgi:uncharacterized membrane protein YqaE (UPF0057 family)
VLYLLAIFLPPVAVLLCGKPVQALLNVVLTLLFWVPGAIHAVAVVSSHNADKRTARLVAAIKQEVEESHQAETDAHNPPVVSPKEPKGERQAMKTYSPALTMVADGHLSDAQTPDTDQGKSANVESHDREREQVRQAEANTYERTTATTSAPTQAATTVSDVRQQIASLRLTKRALQQERRDVMAKQREARAAYTHRNRQGYVEAKIAGYDDDFWNGARGANRAVRKARESDRQHLAHKLRPLEKQRQNIETEIANVDRAILQLQARLVN